MSLFCFHSIFTPKNKASFLSRNAKQAATFLRIRSATLLLWLLGLRAPLSIVGRIWPAWEHSMRAHSELWPTWQSFAHWLIENWWTSISVHISKGIKAFLEHCTYKTGNHKSYLFCNFNLWGNSKRILVRRRKQMDRSMAFQVNIQFFSSESLRIKACF